MSWMETFAASTGTPLASTILPFTTPVWAAAGETMATATSTAQPTISARRPKDTRNISVLR